MKTTAYAILKNGQDTKFTYDSLTAARTKMRELFDTLDKKYPGTPRFMGRNSCSIVCPYGLVHFEIESF
jgi:hypothetical protein